MLIGPASRALEEVDEKNQGEHEEREERDDDRNPVYEPLFVALRELPHARPFLLHLARGERASHRLKHALR